MKFVKAGDLFVNFDLVTMARVRDGDLLVYFHRDKRVWIKGAEAIAYRRFLEADAVDAGSGEAPPRVTVDEGPDSE
jgi:hypothetical protein